MSGKKSRQQQPSHGKRERYIQPSILMALNAKSSYGYELIQDIHQFGFVEGQAPPGMIYRHLRQLEEDGWVSSEWETEGTGPAKRVYRITPDGEEMLTAWIEFMESRVKKLNGFIELYYKRQKGA
ncbi:MAG: PadR family transcriptional regulator [bacterium]|nr:PadR family transcriptional regulator [bacterium]